MQVIKRITTLTMILMLILKTGIGTVSASYNEPQTPPSMVRVEAENEDEPPIGYNEFDKNYVDIKWNASFPPGASAGYLNVYTQEITKPYKTPGGRIQREKNISSTTDSIRIKELEPGTIYYIDMTAYHTSLVDNATYTSQESVPSNKVKVLTDISLAAYSSGTNKIKIEWDDVWNSGGRIDYKLYISENSSFTNTPPIYIGQAQIGADKPVTVNEDLGKLEYLHTVRDPGRVYYVRIEPDIADTELKKTQYTKTVSVSSFILVKTTKVSTTDSGVIWRLEWSPVVTGLSDSSIKILYHVYRGVNGSNDLPQYMAAVDGTNFFVTLPSEESQNYFVIRAIVTKDGEEVYKGIRIESDRIVVGEQEVSSRPVAPEIVDEFVRVAGDAIISYKNELKPDSATVLWRVPSKGDGQADNDVAYDIWLINDPNLIDNPPESTKVASDIRMGNENHIMNGNTLIGYKYAISQLTANSTYYFKIVAKKQFIEYVDDILQNVTYYSDPAYKVIITPAEGPIEQPLVPARPPLKVKKSSEGRDMITKNTVTIQLKNLWYEKYNYESRNWEYIRTEKLSKSDVPPFIPSPSVVDDVYYRKVVYDQGVTIDVGCIEYTEGMSYNDLNELPADKITSFPITANDSMENPRFNPDEARHNVDITLTNLEPNTMYVIWVRASRQSINFVSEPSDPVIITTGSVIVPPLEKPVVPYFNYNLAGDDFIDIGWEFNYRYDYYLKYSTEDDISKAIDSIPITHKDLSNYIYYRVEGLEPDTLYYFWVQAESVSESGESMLSEWSDSYPVKTLPFMAPDTPRGFGLKNIADAVTKNSITFEWIQEEGKEYILEISGDLDYKELNVHNPGEVSEYKVEGLRSNHRYYARLYSYDAEKQMKSEPTRSITVRTKRSNDDYDSDQDVDSVITGDFIEIDDSITGGTWNIRITGINADRFVEHILTDNILDYKIDLATPPAAYEKARILVSDKVFKALTDIKENLVIDTGDISLVIRPGVIGSAAKNPLIANIKDIDYEIVVSYPKSVKTKVKNMTFKTGETQIQIGVMVSGSTVPVTDFSKPLKISIAYSGSNWYKEESTFGFLCEPSQSLWKRLETSAVFDGERNTGIVSFELGKTGKVAVATIGKDYFDDIYSHKYETSINNVASINELKSVTNRRFEPDRYATLADTVKLMMDILGYDYGADFMQKAAKAGLIDFDDVGNASSNCTFDKALLMLQRVLELKTGQSLDKTDNTKFMKDNGFVVIKDSGKIITEDESLTRGDVALLIEKLLIFIGELG